MSWITSSLTPVIEVVARYKHYFAVLVVGFDEPEVLHGKNLLILY